MKPQQIPKPSARELDNMSMNQSPASLNKKQCYQTHSVATASLPSSSGLKSALANVPLHQVNQTTCPALIGGAQKVDMYINLIVKLS